MDTTKKALGIFSDCLLLLIKEHEPSKTVFQKIRGQWATFTKKLREVSAEEISIDQTGSSYDELHLSRVLTNEDSGTHVYYPPIDFDFMMTFEQYKLLDKSCPDLSSLTDSTLQDLRSTSSCFAVMVATSSPGYVKLLVTDSGRQMLRKPNCKIGNDINEEHFLPNWVFKRIAIPEELQTVTRGIKYVSSGPALSNVDNEADGFTYDFVYAFPCETWPELAVNWTKRYRPFDWPPKHLLEEIIQGGCAVVPVGHHESPKASQDLEWRVSFNAGERKLSKHLLPQQRNCYSLVKLILKSTLSSRSILTSYHVKNMMFWFCEQQYGNEEDWTMDTQGDRIVQFIDYIANALAHYSIPHYFIPPNNMVSHRSKREIDETRKEVIQVKEKIVASVFLACLKLQVFEQNPFLKLFTDEKGDMEQLLTLYVSIVQILFKVGVLNLSRGGEEDSIQREPFKLSEEHVCSALSIRSFSNIIALNKCLKPHIKIASPKYLAQSIPELLQTHALAFTQSGDMDNAIAAYQIMLETDKVRVLSDYPEVFTNMACIYTNKIVALSDKEHIERLIASAERNFHKALELIPDSPSLHLAFGNFLRERKRSMTAAIEQFEKATQIDVPRANDDALIQLVLPGSQQAVGEPVYVSGTVAAYYSLCRCYMQTGDIYAARKTANRLESETLRSCSLKQRYPHFMICALSYKTCGLHGKADVVKSTTLKYKPLS